MDIDYPTPDPDQDCLCLFCGKAGHVVEKCPHYRACLEESKRSDRGSTTESSDSGDDTASASSSPPFDPLQIPGASQEALCKRCNELEVLGKFESHVPIVLEDVDSEEDVMMPIDDDEEEEEEEDRERKSLERTNWKTAQIRPLGPILSLRLLSTCPLCCLIFHATELEDEEKNGLDKGVELVVVTGWVIHRLEPGLSWEGYEEGEGLYAKCLYTSATTEQSRFGMYEPQKLVEDTEEAIGLIAENLEGVPTLGVRQVDPQTPDYKVIKGWLSRCNDLHHKTCRPWHSADLKEIKLVDVETRQIVMYPTDSGADDCDYVALSYVWGGVEQPCYKLGDTLPAVPKTLEDAMVVTRKLDKQYLWADSLCINQEDNVEKDIQIVRMSAIYSGAWATIIDLSGKSAYNGLPRVGTLRGVVSQHSWEIWGKGFLSIMPTLSQQVLDSHWATRAWTYQEGLLSPRRLFFTNHQVYFECNSVQCCESLDDSKSPFHLQSDEERQAALEVVVQDEAEPESVIGRGVLRDPFRPISNAKGALVDFDNFEMYLRLMNEFTARRITYDADLLNAFSGVLMRLEEHYYKGGFLQGLPVDDLPRALSWFHPGRPRRRAGFPAWTWAGWKGEVSKSAVHGAVYQDKAVTAPLRIWKAGKDNLPELVYNFNLTHKAPKGLEEEEEDFSNDPVFQLAKAMRKTPTALPKIDEDELLVQGIVVQLGTREELDYLSGSDEDEELLAAVRLEGYPEPQEAKFYGHNANEQANNDQLEFLLVSREATREDAEQRIYNTLLSIELDGDTANRVGVASLKLDKVELLEQCKPERKLFKLR